MTHTTKAARSPDYGGSPIITSLSAAEILDSRGLPTVEVTLTIGNQVAVASVPSGKSTGRREALELRDGNPRRFNGKGVLNAVAAVNGEIASVLVGTDLPDQLTLDDKLRDLDGTPNKQRLGANAILGVSLAAAKLRSVFTQTPLYLSLSDSSAFVLPVPCFNVINGGAHAPNELDFQEFMLVPAGFATYADALRAGAETYHALADLLEDAGLSTAVGDEGGFASAIARPEAALGWIMRAIERAGYRAGEQIFIALEPAANGFFVENRYRFASLSFSAEQMTELYQTWLDQYPIISIEDGLAEDDIEGWKHLTTTLGHRVQLVGDDIFVSDANRVRWAIEQDIANGVLLKPNQVGTVSEIVETARVARVAGYRLMMSHRSGETNDAFIANLAVALETGQIKAGAPARGERLAKYNELLRIERELGNRARFGGLNAFLHAGTS